MTDYGAGPEYNLTGIALGIYDDQEYGESEHKNWRTLLSELETTVIGTK